MRETVTSLPIQYWNEIKKSPPKLIEKSVTRGKRGKYNYLEPCFADTETSKITHEVIKGSGKNKKEIEVVDDTWVYLWAMTVGGKVYYGRYLHEFFQFIQELIDLYQVTERQPLTIYFHNLSYDISYMWDLIGQYLDKTPDTLFVSEQHPLQISCHNGVIFKCSYKLVNKSLDKWCKDLNVTNKKKTGLKDYNAIYYPDSELPENEYIYQAYDVISQRECFYKELDIRGYNFANVPLTVTGFVRRKFQKAYLSKGNYYRNKKYFDKSRVNDRQYDRLIRASMGGMTEGNYELFGQTIYCDQGIGHADFDSHYPTQQVTKPYPHIPSTIYDDEDNIGEDGACTFETLNYYRDKGRYYLVDIDLYDLRLKKEVTMSFIPFSKCQFYRGFSIKQNVKTINGKIIAVRGVTRLTITNFDLQIYLEQYDITGYYIHALDVYTTKMLPSYILDTVKDLYKGKTELKLKEGKAIDDGLDQMIIEDLHQNLMLQKGDLNGVFGCTYTRIKRENIKFNITTLGYEIDGETTLEEYYEKINSCMPYQAGVWTTALARFELYTVISKVIGYENILYCDTDSAFFIPTPEVMERLKAYNEACLKDSIDNDYYVEYEGPDGKLHKKYFHKFDFEKDHCKSKTFRYLHAKCYAMEPDGELKITIAGVSAYGIDKDGKRISREEELGDINKLEDGFTFYICGGTRADYSTIRPYKGYSGGGCAILNNSKRMSEIVCSDIDLMEVFEE